MAHYYDANWLADYETRRKAHGNKPTKRPAAPKRITAAELVQTYESPHWKALADLAKNPGKFKGHQEHYEQVRILWHYEQASAYIYSRLHATPNGGYRTDKTGGEMKDEGQKKGYPDLTLDVARGIYHGLRLELKYGKNTLAPEQIQWLQLLDDEGYYCVACWGAKEAIDVIAAYERLEPGQEMIAHINDHKWKRKR
jgi:hypothetical protein